MGEMSVDYINPFLMAATGIIKDACQVELSIGKPYIKKNDFDDSHAIIMIGLTGQLKGQVLLAFKIQSALTVASKMMMGMPVNELDDMAKSAVSELGNMIMGNAATILSQKGIIVDITPPSLAVGTVNITTSYARNVCVPLESDEISMEINVAIKTQ